MQTKKTVSILDQMVSPVGPSPFSIVRENAGFTIHEKPRGFDFGALAENALKVLSAIGLGFAVALWAAPEIVGIGADWQARAALSAGFILVSFAVFRHANKGYGHSIRVNTIDRSIWIMSRNINGRCAIRQRLSMRDIKSCFLRRGESETARSRFYFNLGHNRPLLVAVGAESHLMVLIDEVADALNNPRKKIDVRRIRPERPKPRLVYQRAA